MIIIATYSYITKMIVYKFDGIDIIFIDKTVYLVYTHNKPVYNVSHRAIHNSGHLVQDLSLRMNSDHHILLLRSPNHPVHFLPLILSNPMDVEDNMRQSRIENTARNSQFLLL